MLDPAMIDIHRLAMRVARTRVNVLLLAETGSGKKVLTETIHQYSGRKAILRLNCAAFSANLLERELFGYENGAFAGATQSKPGLLEMAHEGTALLDEIGEMPSALQAKLLRVIEDRKVTRVGGLEPRDVNVRFISATSRDLAAEVACGQFRADLYYRLNGILFKLPPLRERPSEIVPLAQAFLRQVSNAAGRRVVPSLSADVRARLSSHTWPGNVRELRNVIERAVVLCDDGDVISGVHLWIDDPSESSDPRRDEGGAKEVYLTYLTARDAGERQRIVDGLARCNGNQTAAAKVLGISRRALASRLVRYNIPRPRDVPQRSRRVS